MSYEDKLEEVAASSQDDLQELLERFKDGDLTGAEFVAAATAATVKANARAAVFADVALAADLTARSGSAVAPIGLGPDPGDAARLGKSFATLLDELDPGPLTQSDIDRIRRLAREEPLATAARSRGEGIARSRLVEGWTRQLDRDPCPLCIDWAGPVLPPSARMARHTSCSCVQIPAMKTLTYNARGGAA